MAESDTSIGKLGLNIASYVYIYNAQFHCSCQHADVPMNVIGHGIARRKSNLQESYTVESLCNGFNARYTAIKSSGCP
jgi:hypothetical protein